MNAQLKGLAVYLVSGSLAYGHFWNTSEQSWDLYSRIIAGIACAVFNPFYWSTVFFGG